MSNPQERQGLPEKTKSPGSAAYPLQLVVLIIVIALATGVYFYFTAGEDEGAGSLGPQPAQTVELPA